MKNAALWFGNVDDLWRIGLPSGVGEPWKNTKVLANTPSDPYLMLGYDHKLLELSHESHEPVTFRIEVYVAADDSWSGSIHTSFLSKGLRTPPPE